MPLYPTLKLNINFNTLDIHLYYYIAALSPKSFLTNLSSKFDRFLTVRSQFDTNHRVNFSMPTYCQSATFGPLAFCVCPLFFTTKNQKEFRIATVAIFRGDLYNNNNTAFILRHISGHCGHSEAHYKHLHIINNKI